MKTFVCELCSGNDIIKQEGYFVCQSCGAKYSVEEARKLMTEDTDDVKTDNSDKIGECLDEARRAMQAGEFEEVIKYYSMVKEEYPAIMEVLFYSAYAKLILTLGMIDLDYRSDAFDVLVDRIKLLTDIHKTDSVDDKNTLLRISDSLIELFGRDFICERKWIGEVSDHARDRTIGGMVKANYKFAFQMYNIANNIVDESSTESVFYYKLSLKHFEFLLNDYADYLDADSVEENIKILYVTIHEIDPSYEIPFEYEETPDGEGWVIRSKE